jgi:hypothetical protein
MRSSSAVASGIAGLCLVVQLSFVAFAQVQKPQVSSDRVDDVADGVGNPFPRFDDFSWRAFIALNWPALTGAANRGQPDRNKRFGDPGPRVWETWKARFEVFAPGASQPAPWNSYDGGNPCGGVGNDKKMLSAFSHFGDFNQAAFTLQTLANPLVAQNRTYTRYEVRFNKEQFDTIFKNEWYIKKKQPTAANPGTFADGSIEVKAAWRILNERDTKEIRARYYVTEAFVFDPEATAKAGAVVCNQQDVALVGFHIVIKTPLRPQWIWSSFEHIDNVPPAGSNGAREPDAKDAKAPYSYNSGNPPNDLAPPKAPLAISEGNPPSSNPDPMQVVRKQRITPDTMNTNRAYWALPEIKGTVWENYMLVLTQWPSAPANPSIKHAGAPFPIGPASTLADTTMETYQQKAGSSCMECHHVVSNQKGMDFVAFMAIDATDPPQEAITRSVRGAGAPAPASKGLETIAVARTPQRTALDDDPSIAALADFLRQIRDN